MTLCIMLYKHYQQSKHNDAFIIKNKLGGCNIVECFQDISTVYSKKYAHGFCFAVLCCGYTLTDFPISIRLTSLALWQSNDCPSASKATHMNMDKYFMWIHYERLHNHNKAKHNKTVRIFLGIYCNYTDIMLEIMMKSTFKFKHLVLVVIIDICDFNNCMKVIIQRLTEQILNKTLL